VVSANPLVSIIIPTYNRPKQVKEAIRQSLYQTYNNVEVLVVDDCSEYSPQHVIESFDDERLHFIQNETNKGAPFSRNKGWRESNGDYVNFLDDDDTIFETKIEKQVNKFLEADDEDLGVVTCDVEYDRSDISEVKKNRKHGWIHRDLLVEYCVYGTETMLIKREYLEKVGGFDERLPSNQEYDLGIRLSNHCTYDFVPEVLARKNESENQISFDFRCKIDGTRILHQKYKEEYAQLPFSTRCYVWLRYVVNMTKYYIGLLFGRKAYNGVSWLVAKTSSLLLRR
jgi:glycosyltransferase involved in cell wall biosynthesis